MILSDHQVFSNICLAESRGRSQQDETHAKQVFQDMKSDKRIEPRENSFKAVDADGRVLLAYFSHRPQGAKKRKKADKNSELGRGQYYAERSRVFHHGLRGLPVRWPFE